MKRLFIVKREVWANSILEALMGRGRVYEVIEKYQPDEANTKRVGFKNKTKTA